MNAPGTVAERWAGLQERLSAAASRAGRPRDGIEVLAVTKTFGPDVVTEAFESGLRTMGENRVQEARQKIPLCPGGIEWHLVGHLQSNKLRDAVALFDVIHSVDSLKLLERLDRCCAEAGKTMRVLLQVNVAAERSKFGMSPEALRGMLPDALALPQVDVCGLMTIPPFDDDPERTRPYFAALRELRDLCVRDAGVPLETLSMGMSGDFEVAIEEGSTCVRVGTALFGRRRRKVWQAEEAGGDR